MNRNNKELNLENLMNISNEKECQMKKVLGELKKLASEYNVEFVFNFK